MGAPYDEYAFCVKVKKRGKLEGEVDLWG